MRVLRVHQSEIAGAAIALLAAGEEGLAAGKDAADGIGLVHVQGIAMGAERRLQAFQPVEARRREEPRPLALRERLGRHRLFLRDAVHRPDHRAGRRPVL